MFILFNKKLLLIIIHCLENYYSRLFEIEFIYLALTDFILTFSFLTAVGFPIPSTFSTSNQESESGIDSFEMDSSTRLNVSNASSKHEEQSNWTCESGNSSWKQKSDIMNWPKKNTSPWSAMSLNQNQQWPTLQSRGDTFLKSLIRTPVLNNEFPPPPPEPETIELVS